MPSHNKLAGVGALAVLGMFTSLTAIAQTSNTAADGMPDSARRSWIPYTTEGYIGGNIGRSDYSLGSCAPGISCDDKSVGFKVFTGGRFSPLFGVELGYFDLGKVDRNGGDVEAQGANLSLLGSVPIGDIFSLFGKVGGNYAWTKTSSTVSGIRTGRRKDLGLSYGAGLQFDFTPILAVRADWDRYHLNYAGQREKSDLYSVGLLFKF